MRRGGERRPGPSNPSWAGLGAPACWELASMVAGRPGIPPAPRRLRCAAARLSPAGRAASAQCELATRQPGSNTPPHRAAAALGAHPREHIEADLAADGEGEVQVGKLLAQRLHKPLAAGDKRAQRAGAAGQAAECVRWEGRQGRSPAAAAALAAACDISKHTCCSKCGFNGCRRAAAARPCFPSAAPSTTAAPNPEPEAADPPVKLTGCRWPGRASQTRPAPPGCSCAQWGSRSACRCGTQ